MTSASHELLSLLLFIFFGSFSEAKPNRHIIETRPGCPLEHYYGIRVTNPKNGYSVGEVIEFHCDVPITNNLSYAFLNFGDEEFFVYPSRRRVCLENYTWSGKPPVCVFASPMAQGIDEPVFPYETIYCTTPEDCVRESESLVAVHSLTSSNYAHKLDHQTIEKQLVLFRFNRPYYFTSMSFERSSSDFKIEVRVTPQDIVTDISAEVLELLATYNKAINRAERNKGVRDVIPLVIYSHEILVEFSEYLKPNNTTSDPKNYKFNWNPKATFIPIKGINGVRDLPRLNCPKRPTIPNAFVPSTENSFEYLYICKSGFKMYNPQTKVQSSGLVKCLDGLKWSPDPLPVCYPLNDIEFLLQAKHTTVDRSQHKIRTLGYDSQFKSVTITSSTRHSTQTVAQAKQSHESKSNSPNEKSPEKSYTREIVAKSTTIRLSPGVGLICCFNLLALTRFVFYGDF